MNKPNTSPSRPKAEPKALGELLKKYQLEDKGGHITQEFQDFGFRLSVELSDPKHKSLYMKLAKTEDRFILEKALQFVKDSGATKPGALFMWKVKELKKSKKNDQSNLAGLGLKKKP